MSTLVMWNLMSLDGFFQGVRDWDLGWHGLIVDEEFRQIAIDQLRSADRLIFGRVTYQGMAAHWQTATDEIAKLMNALPKFVFSRTMPPPQWANTTLIRENAASEVRKLKRIGDGLSLVFGSAHLCETLMTENLFDEYRVLIAPVILGSGKPLFGRGTRQQALTLLEARKLNSGGIILRYRPANSQPDVGGANPERAKA